MHSVVMNFEIPARLGSVRAHIALIRTVALAIVLLVLPERLFVVVVLKAELATPLLT